MLESSKKFGIEFRAIKDAIETNYLVPGYIVESIKKILTENNLPLSVIVCGMAYKHDLEDMRDSPGFKMYSEFQRNGFQTAAYDPYYKKHLEKKYLHENNMEGAKMEIIYDLSDDSIKNYSCLCIVQHHTKSKFDLDRIYKNSLIPFIYDCQNKIKKIESATTILKSFGN